MSLASPRMLADCRTPSGCITNGVKKTDIMLLLLLVTSLLPALEASSYHVVFMGSPNKTTAQTKLGYLYASGSPLTVTSSQVPECLVTVQLNSKSEIPYVGCSAMVPTEIGIKTAAIKVSSSLDFKLHVVQQDEFGNKEGYLAIEDNALGTEYHVTTYCTIGGTCQFSITAVEDSTSVFVKFKDPQSVTPPCTNANGMPFTLNEFDVLYFESTSDLTGTVVTADKKIGVFVGAKDVRASTSAAFGNGTTSFMLEQLIPANHWGKTFYVLPHHLNDAGDIVKILTKTDSTLIDITGFSPFFIPKAGDIVERRIDKGMPAQIRASNPIQVIQLLNIDLYEQSVSGYPAMVIVQSEEQWTADNLVFFCETDTTIGETFIVLVSGPLAVPPTIQGPVPPTKIADTEMLRSAFVQIQEPFDVSISIAELHGGYGYCAFSAAMLLGIDLSKPSEDCAPSPSQPGDDRDNNCNGEIDEEVCDATSLSQQFNLNELGASQDTRELPVDGIGSLSFFMKSCGIAQLRLRSSFSSTFYDIQITPVSVAFTACVNAICDYVTSTTHTITPAIDCNDGDSYKLTWQHKENSFALDLTIKDNVVGTAEFTTTSLVRFDKLAFSSIVFSSTFEVDLTIKDCQKTVPTASADNYGNSFTAPVASTDTVFSLFVTPKNAGVTVNVNISYGSYNKSISNVNAIVQDDIEWSFDYLEVELSEEASVYMYREINGDSSGTLLYPVDVLGPAYYVVLNDSLDTSGNAHVFFKGNELNLLGGADPRVVTSSGTKITILSENSFLHAKEPVAVFRGVDSVVRAQMPPRETLGRQFYLPRLDLSELGVTGMLRFIATDDSTVVTIRGDYDNVDTKLYARSESPVDRPIENNKRYNITSNKPAQVHVELIGTDTKILLVLPPVQQFTTVSKVPNLTTTGLPLSFIKSTGVYNNGTEISESVLPKAIDGTGLLNDTMPFFYITFVQKNGTRTKLAVPSDVKLADINEPCTICLPEEMNDTNRDCDCDGLVKEGDQCDDTDSDIDGAINEDCVYTTGAAPITSINLNVLMSSVDCDLTTNSPTTPVPTNPTTTPTSTTPQGPFATPMVTQDTPPTFTELVSSGHEIITSTTETPTVDTNDTIAAPEETCTIDCVCPCGWVNVQNYTQEELQMVVDEIQEKLRINKQELSAMIRKKKSAQDDRPSAKAVGSVGIAFFVMTISFIVLLDLTSLARDLRLLRDNLRAVLPI